MTDTDNFFKPRSVAANLSRDNKTALTDTTAKGILEVEAAARAGKTAHLSSGICGYTHLSPSNTRMLRANEQA